jgi:hypothetical protein
MKRWRMSSITEARAWRARRAGHGAGDRPRERQRRWRTEFAGRRGGAAAVAWRDVTGHADAARPPRARRGRHGGVQPARPRGGASRRGRGHRDGGPHGRDLSQVPRVDRPAARVARHALPPLARCGRSRGHDRAVTCESTPATVAGLSITGWGSACASISRRAGRRGGRCDRCCHAGSRRARPRGGPTPARGHLRGSRRRDASELPHSVRGRGQVRQVLLSLSAFEKRTQKTPPAEIALAESRLGSWRHRGRASR